MKIPQGFECWYSNQHVLLLLKNKAEPFLYFVWTATGLIIWLSWVDDCLVTGNKEGVLSAKRPMMDRFDCDQLSGICWMQD